MVNVSDFCVLWPYNSCSMLSSMWLFFISCLLDYFMTRGGRLLLHTPLMSASQTPAPGETSRPMVWMACLWKVLEYKCSGVPADRSCLPPEEVQLVLLTACAPLMSPCLSRDRFVPGQPFHLPYPCSCETPALQVLQQEREHFEVYCTMQGLQDPTLHEHCFIQYWKVPVSAIVFLVLLLNKHIFFSLYMCFSCIYIC